MNRSRFSLLAVLVGLGLALLISLPSPAGEEVSADKIDKLIEQMGSGTFSEREKASKALDAIGVPALDALRKAVKSDDAEVKRRAQDLLKRIEKRAESAAVLAPKRLRLVYKDMPLKEAVADFQKKSGYAIHLHDPEGKLKERKLTLDTGETTFWHAYGLFCEKAGLVEPSMQDVMQWPGAVPVFPGAIVPQAAPVPAARPAAATPPPPPAAQRPALPANGYALTLLVADTPPAPPAAQPVPPQPAIAPARVGRIGGPMPFVPGSPGSLLLKPGKPDKLPTDDRGAVRVRALPKANQFGAAPQGEFILALEATPEPRLQLQQVQSVRIEKALDDQGQKLMQVTPQVAAAPGAFGFAGGPPGMRIARPIGWGGFNNQQTPVQFKKGEKAAKSLKELTGVLTAHVLSEAKPMITAKLDKAAGKTFKGTDGGFIKIVEVKTDEQKKTTIRLEFEQPPNAVADMMGLPQIGPAFQLPRKAIKIRPAPPAVPPPPPAAKAPAAKPAVVRFQAVQARVNIQGGGGVVVMGGLMGPNNGLTILDDKGKTLPVQMGQQQIQFVQGPGGNAVTAIYTLICPPGKDHGEPAKVVFMGRKNLTIDIPFTLKDVPLP